MSADLYGIKYGGYRKSEPVIGGEAGGGRTGGGDLQPTSLRIDQYGIIEDIGSTLIDPPATTDEVIAVTLSVESFITESTADIKRFIDFERDGTDISDSIVRMMAGAGYIALRKLKAQGASNE